MNPIEKYNRAFADIFAIDITALDDHFSKETVGEWDSVHQLSLVANLEESFDVMLEPEDIMSFTSYQAGKMILAKYDIIL